MMRGMWSMDMSAIYLAGHFAASGDLSLIYDGPPGLTGRVLYPEKLAFIYEQGVGDVLMPAYVYPPLWAFVASPLAMATDAIAFFDITRVLSVAAFSAAIVLAWRIMAPRHLSATSFTALSIVLATVSMTYGFAVYQNQPQMLVTFLLLLSFERYLAGKPMVAGAVLGLVAAIKVSPIFFCLIFLAERDWKAAGAAIGTAALLALVSLGLGGVDLHLQYLELVRQFEAMLPMHGLNITFETLMHDLFVPVSYGTLEGNPNIPMDTAWVSWLSKALMVGGLALVFWVTRGAARTDRIRLRLVFGGLALAFFSPLAWIHHYLFALLLIPALPQLATRPGALFTALLALVAQSTPFIMGAAHILDPLGLSESILAKHIVIFPMLVLSVLVLRPGAEPRAASGSFSPIGKERPNPS